jgi:RNA polymerase sigma-70 factor, ECF subfamily
MMHHIWHILAVIKHAIERLTDEALMLRFGEGETEAFEELLTRYEKRVLCFIRRYVGNEETAADLMQETFIRVIRAASRYKPTAAFSTWILRIARNLCTDYARKMKPHKHQIPFEDNAQQQPSQISGQSATDGPTLNHEIRTKLEHAVDGLPSKQREVFVLRQLLNLSFKEIADVVDSSENTVKSRMRYALEGLRLELYDFYTGAAEGGADL